MNLAGWDLNLLVVFDALMAEKHVTRASERIGLSQPATSNALARLRKLTQDELFIRTEGSFQPTPVAIALAAQIQPALQQIDAALAQAKPFDPATSDRVFTIGMSDYTAFLLLPDLLKTIKVAAPQVAVQVRTGERDQLLRLLDEGKIDVNCGVFPEKVPWHNSQKLFEETFVCVCRRGHPQIGRKISIQQYVEVDHLTSLVEPNKQICQGGILAKGKHGSLSTTNDNRIKFMQRKIDNRGRFSKSVIKFLLNVLNSSSSLECPMARSDHSVH